MDVMMCCAIKTSAPLPVHPPLQVTWDENRSIRLAFVCRIIPTLRHSSVVLWNLSLVIIMNQETPSAPPYRQSAAAGQQQATQDAIMQQSEELGLGGEHRSCLRFSYPGT